MPKMKLSEIGSLSRGKSKHRPRNDKILYGGKYPFVQTSDIKNANHILQTYEQTYNEIGLKQSKLWSKNTICITIAANIADSAILGFDACFPDSVIGLTVNDKIANYHYVEYLLQYYKRIIQNQSNGTSQENINLETFEQVYFDIPSLDIQNDISNILYSIDKKIELNNKINSELEHFAKTLYEYWFVQFDFPDENERPYKSSGGKMIYNEKLKREIPINWEVKQIGSILQEQEKSSVQVNQANNTGKYPFFTSGNEILKYDEFFVDDMHCYLSTGGNACVKYYYGKASYSTDTWCISAGNYSFYLYNYLNSIKSQMDKLYFAGTGLKHLQKDTFKNSYIVVPPVTYMGKYNSFVRSGFKMVSDNYLENQKLTKLRDWLLPMLMNGQISVVAE